jgi:hypothetical protein
MQGAEASRSRSLVMEYLSSAWASRTCPAGQLLQHLIDSSELLATHDRIRLGQQWLERAARGEIHGNIESPGGLAVRDQSSGDEIALGVRYQGGRRMDIAGQRLRVMAVHGRDIEVRRDDREGQERAAWTYAKSPSLRGAGRAVAVRRYLGIPDDVWPVIDDGEAAVVFHFGGATTQAVLELIARHAGVAVAVNGWYMTMPVGAYPPVAFREASASLLDLLIEAEVERLERVLGRPRANSALPLPVRAEEIRGWLDLERQVERICQAQWTAADPATAQALGTLLAGFVK